MKWKNSNILIYVWLLTWTMYSKFGYQQNMLTKYCFFCLPTCHTCTHINTCFDMPYLSPILGYMVNYLLPLPLLCEWAKYSSFTFTPTQIDMLQNIYSIIIPWIGYWLMKQFFGWRIFAVLRKILWNMNIMLQFLVFFWKKFAKIQKS